MTLLVLCYGNPGRGDDGLGPAFAKRLEAQQPPGLKVLTEFQLKVEHAIDAADAEQVVFVDATLDRRTPFTFAECTPDETGNVSSHRISPGMVLALAQLHFGSTPRAHVLGIAGAEFDHLHEGLSLGAQQNLDHAERFFRGWLTEQSDGTQPQVTATAAALPL